MITRGLWAAAEVSKLHVAVFSLKIVEILAGGQSLLAEHCPSEIGLWKGKI